MKFLGWVVLFLMAQSPVNAAKSGLCASAVSNIVQLKRDFPLALSDNQTLDRLIFLQRCYPGIEITLDGFNFIPKMGESPDLALVGYVAKLVAHEVKSFLSERYEKTLRENIAAARLQFPDLEAWEPAEISRQLDVVFSQRMVWVAKLDFYEHYVDRHPELTTAAMEKLRRSRTQGEDMRVAFTQYYGLDPRLVALVWWESIPDVDLTFANPMGKIYPVRK
jgi:hypothetical protein